MPYVGISLDLHGKFILVFKTKSKRFAYLILRFQSLASREIETETFSRTDFPETSQTNLPSPRGLVIPVYCDLFTQMITANCADIIISETIQII